MKKEYLIFAMVVLLVWVSRNNIPPRFQFWKTTDTMITVQNNSGQDLADVTLVVWSEPVERLVGKLDEASDYKMNIQVNFAGVVTAQVGTASAGDSDDTTK